MPRLGIKTGTQTHPASPPAFNDVLIGQRIERYRVLAIVTGQAKRFLRLPDRSDHAIQGEVMELVSI